MARFAHVDPTAARHDAVNVRNAHVAWYYPSALEVLAADCVQWEDMAAASVGRVDREKSIAVTLADITFRSGFELAASAARAIRNGQPPIDEAPRNKGIREDMRIINATHAFSRLAATFITVDYAYLDGFDPLTDSEASKEGMLLFDYSERELAKHNGAHGIIANRQLLVTNRVVDRIPNRASRHCWYHSRQDGLYLDARWPAVASDALMDSLTLSAGSPENAVDEIDATHSVTLRPYLSARQLTPPR